MNVNDGFQSRHDRKQRPKHPTGWEPGALLDGKGEGFIIPAPRLLVGVADPEQEPWEQHLRDAGLDPALVEVIPPVEIRTWDALVKDDVLAKHGIIDEYDPADLMVVRKMVYFKARVRARTEKSVDPELMEWILKWKPRAGTRSTGENERAVVVPWSDWQIGKADGDGTEGTIRRIADGFDQTVDYIRKVKPSQILVAPLGDLLENCAGHYAQQAWRTEKTLRDQENTVRRLAVAGLKAFADLADVLVMPVGGNHGENRQNGQSFTDFADNFDVGVFEPVHDQMRENPRFENVRFHIPRADLTQTVDLHGHIVGLVHGHQAKGGGDRMANWWKGQMKARAPIGDADILLNGHFHSFVVRSLGPRTHIQVPAMDGGSDWFDQTAGGGDPAGQIVFTVSEDGWDNLRVLTAGRN